jgi:hypothetical protein
MTPETTLRHLAERLQGSTASPADIGLWEDEKPSLSPGAAHLADALAEACRALAGIPTHEDVILALGLERTGNALDRRFEHEANAATKVAGGRARGQQQTETALAYWRPWVALYEDLVRNKGKTCKQARRAVEREMSRNGLHHDRKTFLKWLPEINVGVTLAESQVAPEITLLLAQGRKAAPAVTLRPIRMGTTPYFNKFPQQRTKAQKTEIYNEENDYVHGCGDDLAAYRNQHEEQHGKGFEDE